EIFAGKKCRSRTAGEIRESTIGRREEMRERNAGPRIQALSTAPYPNPGDPPVLPGRQQKFDKSAGELLPVARPPVKDVLCCDSRNGLPFAAAPFVSAGFDLHRLRSGPFEEPAIVIPPALPEDTYFRRNGGFCC